MTFLSGKFQFRNLSSTNQQSRMVPWQPYNFPHILKTRNSIAERNFPWDNLLCFGHHNTLKRLVEANIRIHCGEFKEIHFSQIR